MPINMLDDDEMVKLVTMLLEVDFDELKESLKDSIQ